jgi:imidazolonepropionase-like amidohydrolase
LKDREILEIFERMASKLREEPVQDEKIPVVCPAFRDVALPRKNFLWMLTLASGMNVVRAQLLWVESVIRRIRNRIVPPAGESGRRIPMNARRILFCVPLLSVFFLGAVGCTLESPPATAATIETSRATLALVHGTLIDGTGADPVPNAVVLIAGERILVAGPAGAVKVPAGVQTIDVEGASILPGFINAHVHLAFNKANLQAWVQGGVTTVRDESASADQIAQLKTLRASLGRDPQYARLISAGTMLAVPGGYGNLFVTSPEEARQAVLKEADEGVDAVKVALEDGYAGASGLPKLTPDELRAIVDTAHGRGLAVSGHITQGAYLQPMLDAGVDDIAHVPYDLIPAGSLEQMVRQNVYLVPTFTVFRNYGAPIQGCVSNLEQFIRLGGKVALGNDYSGGPGEFEMGIPIFELQMMSEAGMTPMQIVVASTRNAAHVLRLEREIGTLEPGKVADVLIVSGNPLDDLEALNNIRMVIHYGTIIRDETAGVSNNS